MFSFFSDKQTADDVQAPNKRGEGFRFSGAKRQDVFKLAHSRRGKIGLMIAAITGVVIMAAAHENHENAYLILAVVAVGALVIYDISSRREWEKTITDQFQNLSRNHDRLVREVARNRTEVGAIKEGMTDTAVAVQAMGKNYAPGRTIEARMIETIIEQLGVMGQKDRASLNPDQDGAEPPKTEDPIDDILNLEVAPPARMTRTPGALEAALSPNFDKFSDTVIMELIRHAVRNDHLDVFVQPIVSLPQRKLRMYEVFARLRANAGAYIPASRYLELAEKESLVSVIDNLLLLRCLQILRDRRNDPSDIPYVLNITSNTLNDTGFMNDLVTFLAQYRPLAARLIFEMPFQDIEAASSTLLEMLDGLSQLGCRFSVDQVRKRRIDINMLKSRHVRFLKLDAGWLLREAKQPDGASKVRKLKTQLDRSGLDLIVEKIEKDAELRELLEYGIDFGQGYLFGKPDLHSVYKSMEKNYGV